jgi:hypothetical protein
MHDVATWLGAGLGLAATVVVGCGEQRDTPACNPSGVYAVCEDSPDSLLCRWSRLYESEVSGAAVDDILEGDDIDGSLRALFPELAGKVLLDADVPVPSVAPVYRRSTFEPYAVAFPIDWAADPHSNNSWRHYFQNLSWLSQYSKGDAPDLDTGAAIVVDWAERSLFASPPLEWTWHDTSVSGRLNAVAAFTERYLRDRDSPNRRVVHAAAKIILTHVYALGIPRCYKPNHNHGVMQDLALLVNVPRYPALRDGPRLLEIAEQRLVAQVERAVTGDGIHIENSPSYQVLFARLVTDAISAMQSVGRPVPRVLVDSRDRLLDALVYQLQPNHTLPQFGDTENKNVRTGLARLIADARTQGLSSPGAFSQLEWVLTSGSAGTQPRGVDRVFVEGGYAAFRQHWSADDPASAITGHLTCNRLTTVHYQSDESAIELYGYGTELIVDTGIYNYDNRHRLTIHQNQPWAHNLLVVDERPFVQILPPGIIAHDIGSDVSWVRCAHAHYAHLGVTDLVRTFAHAKPDTFLVVDQARATSSHRYAQHFHLHPSLSEVDIVNDDAIVARTAGGGCPCVAITSAGGGAIEVVRGDADSRPLQGVYYPVQNTVESAVDVVFEYETDASDVAFPAVIVVSGPGMEPRTPTAVHFLSSGGKLDIAWTTAGDRRRVAIPTRTARRN